MKQFAFVVFFFTLIISCKNEIKKTSEMEVVVKSDSIKKDTTKSINYHEEVLKTIPKNIKPVFGYRFIINGDFDGDGKIEKLVEHYISTIDGKETNKFYKGITNYDQSVALAWEKCPKSFVLSDNKKIDTLRIAEDLQLFGISYLKNEGDLNGDGTDEVSYVVHWADWSNMNTWNIMTFKNHKWEAIYSFEIRDWQLPDLPETFNQRGLFGMEDIIINSSNDTTNKEIEKELLNFKGLVKKIKNNKIRVIYFNNECEVDTMIVNLNNQFSKKKNHT